jgi:uncharacterized DUF497 family protein
MEFEWYEAKDAANRSKHGLGLGEAARLNWGSAVRREDERADYGEVRRMAYAYLRGRLHVCVYTIRDGTVRVISLRKANARERRDYGQEAE